MGKLCLEVEAAVTTAATAFGIGALPPMQSQTLHDQPQPLPAKLAFSGQPATIRIPHDTGVNPAETTVTQARRT